MGSQTEHTRRAQKGHRFGLAPPHSPRAGGTAADQAPSPGHAPRAAAAVAQAAATAPAPPRLCSPPALSAHAARVGSAARRRGGGVGAQPPRARVHKGRGGMRNRARKRKRTRGARSRSLGCGWMRGGQRRWEAERLRGW
eukprot:273867-Prymnesium_polylepis.1